MLGSEPISNFNTEGKVKWLGQRFDQKKENGHSTRVTGLGLRKTVHFDPRHSSRSTA